MSFVPGRSYVRKELHDRFGGQGQGGISTPAKQPWVLLITGETGEQYGYHDGFQEDGTFWYTGEGRIGDMKMVRGNSAIRDHKQAGESLHLFTMDGQPDGQIEYMGEAEYLGHHTEIGLDKEKNRRTAIVFELRMLPDESGQPSASIELEAEDTTKAEWKLSLAELRRRALEASVSGGGGGRRSSRTSYPRSPVVHTYVLRRSAGACEGCGAPAPFKKPSGRPYLEPHHIRRRADAGPDHPRWVIALCPNCHRRVHYGEDGASYNDRLDARAEQLEEGMKRTTEH